MIEQLNHIAGHWWTWAAGMFWQVGLLIVIVAAVDALIRRWAWPQIRYALWLLVLIKLLLPPNLHLSTSVSARLPALAATVLEVPLPDPAAKRLVSFSIVEASAGAHTGLHASVPRSELARSTSATLLPEGGSSPSEPDDAVAAVRPSWRLCALGIWCSGVLLLSLWLWGKLRGLRRGSVSVHGNGTLPASWDRLAARCARQLGLRRVPEVRLTRGTLCPAVTGVFRPVLLVPVGFMDNLSPKSIEHMLLHEFAHIKRGDLYVHGVYMILQILYWYNPLLWLVNRQMHHLREVCCDATVAKHLKDRAMEYRQTLLDIAKRYVARSAEPGLGLLGLFEDSNRLAVRLDCLKRGSGRYPRLRLTLAAVLVCLMMVYVLPMAQGQEQPIEASPTQTGQADQASARQRQALARQIEALEQQRSELQRQLMALEVQSQQAQQAAIEQAVQARIAERQAEASAQVAPNQRQTNQGRERVRGPRPDVPRREPGPSQIADPQDWKQWQRHMESWARQMEEYGRQMEAWPQSPEFLAFQQQVTEHAHDWTRGVLPPVPGVPGLPTPAPTHNVRPVPPDSRPAVPPMPAPPVPPAVPVPLTPLLPPLPTIPPVPVPPMPDIPVADPRVLPTPNVRVAPKAVPERPGLRTLSEPTPRPAPRFAGPEMRSTSRPRLETTPQGHKLVRTDSRMLKLDPGRVIHVTHRVGRINIAGGANDGCMLNASMEVSGKDRAAAALLLDQLGVDVSESSEGLFITGNVPPELVGSGLDHRIDLNLVLPAQAKLVLHHSDGDVSVAGLKGGLMVRHEDGNISCKEISGPAEIVLEDGNVHLERVGAGPLTIKLEDGNVTGKYLQSSANVRVEDGSVSLAYGPTVPDHCTIDVTTVDGHIRLTTPEEMLPEDQSGAYTRQGEGARWHSSVKYGRGNHVISLKAEDGRVDVSSARRLRTPGVAHSIR